MSVVAHSCLSSCQTYRSINQSAWALTRARLIDHYSARWTHSSAVAAAALSGCSVPSRWRPPRHITSRIIAGSLSFHPSALSVTCTVPVTNHNSTISATSPFESSSSVRLHRHTHTARQQARATERELHWRPIAVAYIDLYCCSVSTVPAVTHCLSDSPSVGALVLSSAADLQSPKWHLTTCPSLSTCPSGPLMVASRSISTTHMQHANSTLCSSWNASFVTSSAGQMML